MLRADAICAGYGPIQVLTHVSLQVRPGSITTLLGANGAGKSTLLRTLSGLNSPTAGSITLDDVDLTHAAADVFAASGVAHVPEGRGTFAQLSVLENLRLGWYPRRQDRSGRDGAIEDAIETFPILRRRFDQRAGSLSGGEQQMLAIARGLASSPRLLMLDEPSMGLAPIVVDLIFARIRDLHREMKLAILLVEQRVVEALEPCDWAYMLDVGRCVAHGPPAQIMNNERLKQAYLGTHQSL